MRKAMMTIERYQRKRLPSFDDKSSAKSSAELRFDIWGLVLKQCSTEFKSWKMVHVDLKNFMVHESRKAMTITPRPMTTPPTTATTATTKMDNRLVNLVDPVAKKNTREPCRQLKMAKVTRVTNDRISVGYDERHWAAPMTEQHSVLAHNIGHVVLTFCLMRWKSWKAMQEKVKNIEHDHLLQWKSDMLQYFEMFDDPQVAPEEGCPKVFEDREDSWVWLCGHF
ncbi:hypothetical protein D8674_005902 [Pyrus ussuriensis x Pyrus communis]|uniref:Uncharacterized protein n=1 Tax=Pyrus ussuriensis x Pyrus communis TaxID=2448454 RepID=A0A5N5FSS9_9ROSA|nr:hypothetical protein D8674_005902 [Pyrus ussuriensis x Pyrus communis]